MRRFFAADIDRDAQRAYLDPEESRHLVKVLRLQVGVQVELFDGTGALYAAEVERLGRRVSLVGINQKRFQEESRPSIIVCQGDLKGQKIDYLVEKCTELGVARFIPFTAGRSQGRHDADRRKRKQRRRQTIVKTACKQCGRLRLMEVDPELNFSDLLNLKADGESRLKLMLWELEQKSTLGDVIGHGQFTEIYLMFGPEGGFSSVEADQALSSGWYPVSLGERILRSETATIAAVAIIQHLLGIM